jgi:hypothetical protein
MTVDNNFFNFLLLFSFDPATRDDYEDNKNLLQPEKKVRKKLKAGQVA